MSYSQSSEKTEISSLKENSEEEDLINKQYTESDDSKEQ